MTDKELTLRRLGPKDAPVVAMLLHGLFDELDSGKGPSLASLERTAGDVLASAAIDGILAYHDDQPVGVIMLNECLAIYAGGGFGEITELYVLPAYRSRGVAAKLLEAATEIAREKGWKRFEVGAPGQPAWRRSLEFYIREGFEEVGPRLRRLL